MKNNIYTLVFEFDINKDTSPVINAIHDLIDTKTLIHPLTNVWITEPISLQIINDFKHKIEPYFISSKRNTKHIPDSQLNSIIRYMVIETTNVSTGWFASSDWDLIKQRF